MYSNLLGLDLNTDTQDKIASKVLLLCTLFRLLYQLCKGIIPHERRETLHFISFFFLYFICFWVFTVFTSTQDTSQISTCINLHYTTLLHKENTTTLDYENKRKEKKKKRGIAY